MRKKTVFLITTCAIVLVVVFFELFVFRTSMQQTATDPYLAAYYSKFDKAPVPEYNYTFSPPVSMYQATLIALESDGWNTTSLKNMTVSVWLDYCLFMKSANESEFELIHSVQTPVENWYPQQVGDTTYRYVWTISVHNSGRGQGIPPPGYYWVDAATAELILPSQGYGTP